MQGNMLFSDKVLKNLGGGGNLKFVYNNEMRGENI